jgi:TRAP-type uncharacterized transport system substrate-binding protein
VLRIFLVFCAILLAAVTIAIGASYFALRPNEFKVAVPATDPIDQRVFGLAADSLRTQRAPVRLEVVPVEKSKDAMDALEADKVNLAIVRSDSALIGRTHTVMIMRREAAVIVAPKVGKVQKIADLQNATIGVTREGPLDGSLLAPVLDYYGITRDKTRYIAVQGDGIADAFRQKKIDAMIAVGPVTAKQMGEAVADAARGIRGALQFIEIEEADAIVKRIPALESIEIEQGAFGGRPPRPAESFNTLGYSIRLVTNTKTDADSIAELARQLFLIRQNLSAAIPGAGLMETPDVEEATAFLVHPGVRAYVNGEQRSWFDKYNDYIYLGLFLGSGVGSVAAGLFGWMRSGSSQVRPPVPHQRIDLVFDAVRDARTQEQLDAAEREADEVFRSVFALGVNGKLSGEAIASFNLALGELRSRIAARRAALRTG